MKQKGFALVQIILIVLLVGVVGYVGYKNFNFNNFSPTQSAAPSTSPSPSLTASPTVKPSATPKPKTTVKPTSTPTTTLSPNAGTSNNSEAPATTIALTATPTPEAVTPYIDITYPNSGSFAVGSFVNITWNSAGTYSSFVIMYSSCPSCANNITTVNGQTNSYNWTVNVGNTGCGPYSQTYQIKIVGYLTTGSANGTSTPTDLSSSFTVTDDKACDY